MIAPAWAGVATVGGRTAREQWLTRDDVGKLLWAGDGKHRLQAACYASHVHVGTCEIRTPAVHRSFGTAHDWHSVKRAEHAIPSMHRGQSGCTGERGDQRGRGDWVRIKRRGARAGPRALRRLCCLFKNTSPENMCLRPSPQRLLLFIVPRPGHGVRWRRLLRVRRKDPDLRR